MPFENILRRAPKTAIVDRPIPVTEDGKKSIETGLAEYIRLVEELTELRSKYERAVELGGRATVEINRLRELNSDLKARCTTYQIERDESVSKYAKLQAFLISLYAQMRAFDVPVISASHFAAVDPAAEESAPPPPIPMPLAKPKTISEGFLDTAKTLNDFNFTGKP